MFNFKEKIKKLIIEVLQENFSITTNNADKLYESKYVNKSEFSKSIDDIKSEFDEKEKNMLNRYLYLKSNLKYNGEAFIECDKEKRILYIYKKPTEINVINMSIPEMGLIINSIRICDLIKINESQYVIGLIYKNQITIYNFISNCHKIYFTFNINGENSIKEISDCVCADTEYTDDLKTEIALSDAKVTI